MQEQLINLYAKRKLAKGFQFSSDTVWQKELEASFIYEATADQIKVLEEIKRDMEFENSDGQISMRRCRFRQKLKWQLEQLLKP